MSQAIEINPNYAQAYSNRGFVHLQQGNIQQALTDLNQAIEINPNYTSAYYHRGLTHVQLGKKEAAIADFQKAADLSRQQGDMTLYQSSLDQIQQIQP